ncbi:hypothetical protein V2E25_01600 [Mycoplasmopsis arginini]|uniref:Uncharacterized protein n=1 Tax=Mycoplasmopsis arginini TaxID=2094 RepID=A0ABZ2ANI3_MYCAR|nr:hypothetical protein [Mycoplasmopsis arginini]WVN22269.1 hypothetical protein V2E25_01600 [Mycoplasmopsis arginini]VEU81677.1 Uncharacterised protein [Mycoplasmopsis arginini]
MNDKEIVPATVFEANKSFWKNCDEDFKQSSRFYKKNSYIYADNSETSDLLFNKLINFVLDKK